MKTLKRVLWGILILLLSFLLIMSVPRILGVFMPGKAPIGYHFETLDYAAVYLGFEKAIDHNPAVPVNIKEIKNIEYKNINGKSLQMDFYIPKNIKKPAPLIVFIHGGSWSHGKRSDYLVYLLHFASKGYITATVSYRLIDDATYPACVEDIRDAVHWLFNNGEKYGYDPNRIALAGGSAGGHLALLGAYGWHKAGEPTDTIATEHKIKAVVDIYGPVDFTTEYARNQHLVNRFIAHPYSEKPELYVEGSPIQYLDRTDPPTMILHGTSDKLVPLSQSDTLKARLDRLGIPNQYCKVPLWPHAMDIVQRVNDYSKQQMEIFFKKYL